CSFLYRRGTRAQRSGARGDGAVSKMTEMDVEPFSVTSVAVALHTAPRTKDRSRLRICVAPGQNEGCRWPNRSMTNVRCISMVTVYAVSAAVDSAPGFRSSPP